MSKKIVLTVDGGGIRGLIPLVVLTALEHRLKKHSFIAETLDVYSGTSTGAVIAASLMIGKQGKHRSAAEVLEIYRSRGAQLFISNYQGGPVYKSLPMNRLIEQNFGLLKIPALPKHYVFPLFDTENNQPEIITSYQNEEKFAKENVSSLLLASAAVPDYFEPVPLGGKVLADGVIYAKNPSVITMDYVLSGDVGINDVCLVSLGTGQLGEEQDEIETKCIENHHQVKHLFHRTKGRYFRIQPELLKASPRMDEASEENINFLIEDAQYWVQNNDQILNEIIDCLEER